jgi:hypothetical protein
MRLRQLITTPLAALALLVGGGASAATAEAAYIWSNSGGAYIRAQPNPRSMMYGYFGNGTQLSLYCYVDAEWAYGNYWTNRWFRVNVPSYRYGSPEAYISASLVAAQYPTPHC